MTERRAEYRTKRSKGDGKPKLAEYRFCLDGRCKPYVRMTRNGKWKPEAQAYLASKAALACQFREQMQGREMLAKTPLCVRIVFDIAGKFHNHDTDNLIKAVLDAATGIVYEDDRWVDAPMAVRVKSDVCATTVIVNVMEGPHAAEVIRAALLR